ncbi:hypothetical protein D1970_02195 [Mesobacillus zeae]|uniref:Uncharacterized protein n=1 Tax=Mesobacillus zeae TaxID=1917180 RepID=A0A398BEV5_9BACI|nr:hypothetical protein D1970_02195 [Mesobacillus zeae]
MEKCALVFFVFQKGSAKNQNVREVKRLDIVSILLALASLGLFLGFISFCDSIINRERSGEK